MQDKPSVTSVGSPRVNTITVFKTNRLWPGWNREELEEEKRKLQDWIMLGRVKKENAQRTLDRLNLAMVELEIDELLEASEEVQDRELSGD